MGPNLANIAKESSLQGEGDYTACAVVNQLQTQLLKKVKTQLITSCTSTLMPFPLYRDFPGSGYWVLYCLTSKQVLCTTFVCRKSVFQQFSLFMHNYILTEACQCYATMIKSNVKLHP